MAYSDNVTISAYFTPTTITTTSTSGSLYIDYFLADTDDLNTAIEEDDMTIPEDGAQESRRTAQDRGHRGSAALSCGRAVGRRRRHHRVLPEVWRQRRRGQLHGGGFHRARASALALRVRICLENQAQGMKAIDD